MSNRAQHFYNHHYSDWVDDSGIPIGTIMAIFVDAATEASLKTTDDAGYNYPGWLYCNGQTVDVEDYIQLYEVMGDKYGGTAPATVNLEDWGNPNGTTANATFTLPDLRMKRLNGPGGVDGAGSITPDNSQMQVGDTGGEWYMSRARQDDEYSVGTVRVSGYENCIDFVEADLFGQAELTIGPLQARTLNGPPPHGHYVLCSEGDQRNAGDRGDPADGERTPTYVTNFGQVSQYESDGGFAAEHTHYFAEFTPVKGGANDQYSYDICQQYSSTPDAYTNAFGANKVNDGAVNTKGQTVTMLEDLTINPSPTEAGITMNTGTIAMTGAEQLNVAAGIVPTTPVPLVLKYFRVKYLIKAW
jgi:hypothetical protein